MSTPMQTNAADRTQVAFATRKEKDRARRAVSLIEGQMATYHGRQFVWEELARHGLYTEIAGPSEVVYPQLGRRSAGLELLALVMTVPESYLLMQREAMQRDAKLDREIEAVHAMAEETH